MHRDRIHWSRFFNEIAGDVIDPQTGVSIKERRYALEMVTADNSARINMKGNKNISLGALGAGSDWSGFLQLSGIASMNISFGGEGDGGEYHSIYDSYDHFVKFTDPGFHYEVALAETAGRAMMRMANSDILPFDVSSFYKTVAGYVADLKALLDNSRTGTELENKMIGDKLFDLAKDPAKKYLSPEIKDAVPYLDFSVLENSMVRLREAAEKFQELHESAVRLPAGKQNELNEILYKVERSLINENGLPGRPWFKHQIYAPGLYTGYGVKTLPGIREAIEQSNWQEAQENIEIVSETIEAYAQEVRNAIDIMK